MKNKKEARQHRLDTLLDMALTLDQAEQACFVLSDTVEAELREELAALLKASAMCSPLDRTGIALANLILSEQDDEAHSSVLVGKKLAQYRLIRLLGEGGMATVWLAERDSGDFSRKVAVKCIKTGFITPDGRARFLREQKILAQLQHPNIARLYDAGISDDGVPFIVMEWVDGKTLAQYSTERSWKITEQLEIFKKICTAVAYAHQNLIVHRDIKPSNVLIDVNNEPKLLDFGIAKLLNENTESITRTGARIFTPEYASPEQILDQPITTAADIYALGAVLYELLTGLRARNPDTDGRPFQLSEEIKLPSLALRGEIKRLENTLKIEETTIDRSVLSRRCYELRGDLDTIILKALHSNPDRRYSSAISFSDDIERYLQNQPILARKDSKSYKIGKFLKRHILSVTLGIIVFLALITMMAISLYQARRAENEAARAEIETRQAVAVKDFLTDIFLTSASGLPRNQVPSTETLMEDGAKKIINGFHDAPLVKIDLLLTLGKINLILGKYDLSESLLKEALSISEKNLKPSHGLWLSAHIEWSKILARVHLKNNDAVNFLSHAINIYQQAGGQENKIYIDALSGLALIYKEVDNYNRAVSLYRNAFFLSKKIYGKYSRETKSALEKLGLALSDSGTNSAEAEALLRENIYLARILYGENHFEYGLALNSLSIYLSDHRKDIEAEQLAQQAVKIIEALHSPHQDALADFLNTWGNALLLTGDLDQAEAVYSRVYTIDKQLTGADSTNAAVSVGNLGDVAIARQDYREAEHLFRDQLRIYEKVLGPQHSRVALALRGIAHALTAQQRFDASRKLLSRALEINRNVYGETGIQVGKIFGDLAEVEILSDHAAKALVLADQSLAILGKSLDENHPEWVEVAITKGEALSYQGRYLEAFDWLEVLMKRVSSETFSAKKTLVRGWKAYGYVQNGLGKKKEAIQSWNEGLALLRPMKYPDTGEMQTLERLIREASAETR